ncbi:MAG TPA: fumarylacetoacetate hydrolase family protein [Bryobacteraceae bacterium]|nr:fumarylacetoacetate hydrolase family protein [Bryobacteraceae bacterium]
MMDRRNFLGGSASAALLPAQVPGSATRYVRFRQGNATSYGILEGDSVREVRGSLFDGKPGSARYKLNEVKLLYPCEPKKALAVGLNYRSHLGTAKPPSRPEIFYKPITCLQNPDDPIVIPADAKNVHYEGELVIVIGAPARNVSTQEARDVIFGVTCGNDVSERDWQGGPHKDLQWWRAKGADSFGPLGPMIVRGVDYGRLMLRTRLNGQVVQQQSTSDLLFDCPAIVSFVSKYVTLTPGDVIYTGTPGATKPMKPGDSVEVEIEGIGVLRNPVRTA